ncbi:MAG TPA: type II toxin-antitoxin system RelE/ParE family toxin [Bacteroidetes bacterium]|nr:type II toxin-antitoxin system RelE/ParE family toxin [Bacteroidota bacterium]
MIYEVRISQKAEKDFIKIPKGTVIKIVEKIESLSKNPYPPGSKKIKASDEELYRVRQGSYRILYVVRSVIKIVEVRRIRHRKDIYKSL